MAKSARQRTYHDSEDPTPCPCPDPCSLHDGAVPWPHYTTDEAASVLTVEPDFLKGFHNNGIRAVKHKGENGMPILAWNREDVEAVRERMR